MFTHTQKTKEGVMSSLFSYNCLETTLEKSTRTLFVTFAEGRNNLDLEVLFELESLLAWCTNRVEIRSIVFKTKSGKLLEGFSADTAANFTEKKLKTIQAKLQKIVFSMHHLPQTIVMDLGAGVDNLAAEFALGADIRIATKDSEVRFNHSELGLVPASGGIAILTCLFGQAVSRNWLLSGSKINLNELTMAGFVFQNYDSTNRDETLHKLLEQIASQSDVARIQTKMAIFENIRSAAEKQLKYDRQISNATMTTGDWKNSQDDNMKAKSMSYAVKLSLVKNEMDDNNDSPNH